MITRTFITLGVLLFSATAWADPVVEGSTISWPDDGWYQVQNALTFESLCEGGQSCTVDPGTYTVINHTTMERYADIVVEDEDLVSGELVVNNQTIHWLDNGWYQVQNAETFESVCDGDTSCAVDPGIYIVINHSTGRRYENVVVGQAHGGGGMDRSLLREIQ